jgi:hypothetical protein
MNWKKWSCSLMILGCFLVWGSLTPLWSGEIDALHLLNLLQKKGVITQEEANDLMKEVRSNATAEKTELKQEIKDDGTKGNLLPSALKGFKFGTTIFSEWNQKSEDTKPSTNSFKLNRGYITLTKEFTPWLGMNVTTDVFSSVDANDKGNGLEIRMKYAYASLNLWGTTNQLGLIPTPSDAYDSAIWPYRVQGKNLLDDLGIQASADFGISNFGVFGGYMDDDYLKFASKPFAGKWGGYWVGLFNGAGYDQTEANTNKAISGLIYFRPAPMIPVLKGLQVGYYGNYGESNSTFTTPGRITSYPDWQVNIAQISFQHSLFTLMGQYYWGKGTKNSTEDNDRSGYLASGFLRIPGLEKLRVFSKYYYYDPNTDKSDDGYGTFVTGLSYDVTKEFMPFASYEHRGFESNQVSKKNDYDMFQVGFQLKF